MSYDHICVGLIFAERGCPFLEQCAVRVAARFENIGHLPERHLVWFIVFNSLYFKCAVKLPATMSADMKTGVKVQAIDELGRYADGQQMKESRCSSGRSTIRLFPCRLAASVCKSLRPLWHNKCEVGKLFSLIYAAIYVLIYSYTVFTVVYYSHSYFGHVLASHMTHQCCFHAMWTISNRKFSPLIMHFVDWFWYWATIIPMILVMIWWGSILTHLPRQIWQQTIVHDCHDNSAQVAGGIGRGLFNIKLSCISV